jgi:HAE1 family hydrophobic/amphiphilic exporter-1
VIALLLIYLVLVAATESFVQPVVIIAAAPFACAGAVYALSALGLSVNLPVYVGLIILCGLVVNVNIVLVYAINDRLRSGLNPEEATLQGVKRRARPIFMTTLTTICASAPMLIDKGAGSATWFPFAVTLASGLTASALFSLLLTPAVYLVGIRAKRLLKAM